MKKACVSKMVKWFILPIAVILLLSLSIIAVIANSTVDYGEKFNGVQLSASGDVKLTFYYDNLSEKGITEMCVKYTDRYGNSISHIKPDVTYSVKKLKKTDNGYEVPTLFAPAEMTYVANVYAVKGGVMSTHCDSYSVVEYANKVLSMQSQSKYHQTMKAILNYGAMAQISFDVDRSNLANEGLYVNISNPIDNFDYNVITNNTDHSSNNNVIKLYGLQMFCHTKTTLRVYFTYDGSAELSATVSASGINNESVEIGSNASGYYVDISNISAKKYDEEFILKITDGTSSAEAKVSVLGAIRSALKSDLTAVADKKDIYAAMYMFYYWADFAESDEFAPCDNHTRTHYESTSSTKNIGHRVCSDCGQVLSEDIEFGNVNKLLYSYELTNPAELIGSVTANNKSTVATISSGMKGRLAYSKGCFDSFVYSSAGSPFKTGGTRYIVLKVKADESINEFTVSINTEGVNAATKVNLKDAIGQWQTYIIDGTKAIEGYDVNSPISTLSFDYIGKTGSNIQIEYVGFIKNWSDAENIITDATVKHACGINSVTQSNYPSGTCVACTDVIQTVKDTSTLYNTVYSYVCKACGKEVYTRNAPTTSTYFTLGSMSFEGMESAGIFYDPTVKTAYERFNIIQPKNGVLRFATEENPANLARYAVVKFRAQRPYPYNGDTTKPPYFTFFTTTVSGYNSTTCSCGGNHPISMNLGQLSCDSTWHTFVIDMQWNSDQISEKGAFGFNYERAGVNEDVEQYIDIAYVALCDTWEEIDAIVDESSVRFYGQNMTWAGHFGTANYNLYLSGQVEKPGMYQESCQEIKDSKTGEITQYKYTYAQTNGGTVQVTKTISAEINSYISPAKVMNNNPAIVVEDGEVYKKGGTFKQDELKLLYDGISLNAGRYFVIKLRGQNVTYFGLKFNGSRSYNVYGGFKDNVSQVLVYDLESDLYLELDENGEPTGERYVSRDIPITSIYVAASAGQIDVAYMAICDNWVEIDQIVDDAQVKIMTSGAYSDGNIGENSFTSVADMISNENNTISESVKIKDGFKIYTYTNGRGETVSTKTIPASIPTYISPATTKPFKADCSTHVGMMVEGEGENAFVYDRFNVKNNGSNGAIRFAYTDDEISYTGGRYFVIKMKVAPNSTWNNNYGGLRYTIEGSDEVPYGGYKAFVAGEWRVAVYDLGEAVVGQKITSLYFQWREISGNGTVDIAYAAFCNNWAEIHAIVDEATVYSKTGGAVNVSEKSVADKNIIAAEQVITNADGSTTYNYVNALGDVLGTTTIPANINSYISAGQLSSSGNIGLTNDGIPYNQISNVPMNSLHAYFNSDLPFTPGRYFVIKIKASVASSWFNIKFNGETWAYNYSGGIGSSWAVLVYDFEEAIHNGTIDMNTAITNMDIGNNASATFEIAFMATCDSWAEIQSIVGSSTGCRYMSNHLNPLGNTPGTIDDQGKGQIWGPETSIAQCVAKEATQTPSTDAPSEAITEVDTDVVTEEEATGSNLYGNGAPVKHSGHGMTSADFAMQTHSINEAKAVNVTSAELVTILTNGKAAKSRVYNVTDTLILEGNKTYNGNGCAIIAANGVRIDNAQNVIIKNVVISGYITLDNSTQITFENVDIQNNTNQRAVDIQSGSDVVFFNCKISSSQTAVYTRANNISFYKTAVIGKQGFDVGGINIEIQNCDIIALNNAISAVAESLTVRNNNIKVSSDGIGINIEDGSVNTLIALNIIKDAQSSVVVSESTNTVVLLNSLIKIVASNNTNLYVVENAIGGRIEVTNNNYLICDMNKTTLDSKNHDIINISNQNVNGDNITDINARPNVGANEDLLPHTNKELFLDMTRRTVVRDASMSSQMSYNDYVRSLAVKGEIIIIPPGCYQSAAPLDLVAEHSNTSIYGYGVYQELTTPGSAIRLGSNSADSRDQYVTRNINIYGITFGYDFYSCGQIRVVAKNKWAPITQKYEVTVINSAGAPQGFSMLKTANNGYSEHFWSYITWWNQLYLGDSPYPQHKGVGYTLKDNGDGTMTLTFTDKSLFNQVNVGDTMTCRYIGQQGTVDVWNPGNKVSVSISNSKNIYIKDSAMYGYSTAISVYAGVLCENVHFERWHNTTHSAPIIDKATYDEYAALETKYGIELVYIDEQGRYRGEKPKSGSVDAFHINGSKQGVSVTSSIFEDMVDDGSNQYGHSARLHDVIDNGDGTTTVIYKESLSTSSWGTGAYEHGSLCTSFKVGDRILVYAPDGEVLCRAEVLSATKFAGEVYDKVYKKVNGELTDLMDATFNTYSVTVKTSDVNFHAVEGIDLSSNQPDDDANRVVVDNLERISENYAFDNVLVQNSPARGMIMKGHNISATHCTFRNLGAAGVLMKADASFCEGSIASNIKVLNCLFDNTGCNDTGLTNLDYTPISITSAAYGTSDLSNNGIVMNDIVISGCKFINNKHQYAITVRGARDMVITNNTFEPVTGTHQSDYQAIYLHSVINVNVENNTFRSNNSLLNVHKENFNTIFGNDSSK